MMMTTTDHHLDLWIDWCAVTSTPEDDITEESLYHFARQAGPSQRVMTSLRRRLAPEGPTAPAWPTAPTSTTTDLGRLLAHVTGRTRDPAADWTTRLPLRRLAFAAVHAGPFDTLDIG